VLVEQLDGLLCPAGSDEAAKVHFVEGVWAGQGTGGVGVDQSPGVLDKVVEQIWIAKVPGSARQLYQNDTSVAVRHEFRRAA
jgi:hypothetical protein